MGREVKYVYFFLSIRQLKLLTAAVLRSIAKTSFPGDENSPLYRSQFQELNAIRQILESVADTRRPVVNVILSTSQYSIAGISVRTALLSLASSHPLHEEYQGLIAALSAKQFSRRLPSRDEDSANGLVKL